MPNDGFFRIEMCLKLTKKDFSKEKKWIFVLSFRFSLQPNNNNLSNYQQHTNKIVGAIKICLKHCTKESKTDCNFKSTALDWISLHIMFRSKVKKVKVKTSQQRKGGAIEWLQCRNKKSWLTKSLTIYLI